MISYIKAKQSKLLICRKIYFNTQNFYCLLIIIIISTEKSLELDTASYKGNKYSNYKNFRVKYDINV